MKECCINFMGGGINTIVYCSGDLWNSTMTMERPILCKFCPVCGINLMEAIDKYPELAMARGLR